jgi:type I restriction enzyme S subunit
MIEWKIKRISDFGQICTGTTPSTKIEEYYGGPFKFISPADLDNGKYVTTAHRYLSQKGLAVARVLPPNSILVGCIGNIGKIGLTQDEKSAFNQQINAIICNEDYSHDFIYYLICANRDILIKKAVQTTLPILNKGNFQEIEFLIPPLPEQCKIASILSTVQKAIENQQALIDRTTELKKAMMHKLFTEGTKGEKQKMTEVGLVPESWEVLKFEKIVDFKTGKLNSNAAVPSGQYPFFTCSQETFWIDKYAFNTEAILLSGNNARAVYSVKYFNGKFNAYQRTYIITTKDKKQIEYVFLKHALAMKLEWLKTVSIGTSTKYLTLGILQNLQMALPDVKEQSIIGNSIDGIDHKFDFYKRKKKILEELFRTLLHQLMTAQIRVDNIDLNFLKDAA